MPEPLPARGQVLFDTWQREAANLAADEQQQRQQAADSLLEAIQATAPGHGDLHRRVALN